MAGLTETFERLGHDGVWTYINSGNVVFESTDSRTELERSIESTLETELGFEVTTFVRTAAEVTDLVDDTPFEVAGDDTHFVTLLKSPPTPGVAQALEALSNEMDTLVVRGRDVHWRMHGKSTASTLQSKDWDIVGKRCSTSRNMTMLTKLAAKLQG